MAEDGQVGLLPSIPTVLLPCHLCRQKTTPRATAPDSLWTWTSGKPRLSGPFSLAKCVLLDFAMTARLIRVQGLSKPEWQANPGGRPNGELHPLLSWKSYFHVISGLFSIALTRHVYHVLALVSSMPH
ncbi:hypothetical protein CCMA1212_006832 [Trichoderma ghanense]|uniref:Uncharacterized protein n=1 Tax=Trichoderma ghanense TaxID=65468 RepID=A0ABY2H191_9HYPO